MNFVMELCYEKVLSYNPLLGASELVHSIHRETTSCTTSQSDAALYEHKMTFLIRISSSTTVCYRQLQ